MGNWELREGKYLGAVVRQEDDVTTHNAPTLHDIVHLMYRAHQHLMHLSVQYTLDKKLGTLEIPVEAVREYQKQLKKDWDL